MTEKRVLKRMPLDNTSEVVTLIMLLVSEEQIIIQFLHELQIKEPLYF